MERIATYIGNNKVITKTVFGTKMILDTEDVGITPHIITDGYWELNVSKFILNNIKQGMNVIEIGANMGYYTTLILKIIGKNGKLFSFEANPEMFDILFTNVEINGGLGNVKLFNKAVWSSSGLLTMKVLKKHKGSSYLVSEFKDLKENFNDSYEEIKVESVSLDDIFNSIDIHIDFMKIDAEYSELEILKGAKNLLYRNKDIKIIMEHFKYEKSELLFRFIKEMGFNISVINSEGELDYLPLKTILQLNHAELFLFR